MNSSHNILIGVSGSIAAYRAADLVSILGKRGHQTQCLLTASAREFVSPLVLETLSGRPALSNQFGQEVSGTEHIRLARWAEAFVIAPATADLIARLALGLADDLVTTVAMATEAPLVIAPAMNVVMWNKPVVQEHLQTLRNRGAYVIQPAAGLLACGEEGQGRLAVPEDIADEVEAILTDVDLMGMKLLITAGPTTSPIDAVRYLTNHSTGKMGIALAMEAVVRGAEVVCVCGRDKGFELPKLPVHAKGKLKLHIVDSASEMAEASLAALPDVDGVIASAAVLDYEVAESSPDKLRRSTEEICLRLKPSVDVLAALKQAAKPGQWFCGFAAETGDLLEAGTRKLNEKGLDFLFANQVGKTGESLETGFASPTNAGLLLSANGERIEFPLMPKRELAGKILTTINELLAANEHR